MHRLLTRRLCLLALTVLLTACGTSGQQPFTRVDFLMDTWLEQCWYGKNAQRAGEEIYKEALRMERQFSRFDLSGEIGRLNASAGKEPVALSDEAFEVLSRALAFCEESGGLFDITVAPLTAIWDVTGADPQIPPPEDIERSRALVGYRGLTLDRGRKTAYLTREGMCVDLGGVAKGYAAGAMRAIAQRHGVRGYLSLGGNMMVEGAKPDGSDFKIGIRDPFGEPEQILATMTLNSLTMATTGTYERYFEVEGKRYHHIIDPFTGFPSESDLISVTVIAADGLTADCLSTAVYLGGSEGLAPQLAREDCMVLAVTNDRRVFASSSLWEKLEYNANRNDYDFCRDERG